MIHLFRRQNQPMTFTLRTTLLIAIFAAFCLKATTPDFVFDIAASGHVGELKKLLASGADINMQNEHGTTPLMRAVVSNNGETAQYLIESGADITVTDNLDRDALDWALVSGSLEMARVLMDHHADANRVDSRGNTRLTAAAARGDIAAVNFLLINGANRDAKSAKGMTALKIAQKNKNKEVAKVLADFSPGPVQALQPQLSEKDSIELYSVAEYSDRHSFFRAVQQGRRSFAGCMLKELDLSNMNLASLDFSGADLSSSDLRNSMLKECQLNNTNLRAAYLKRADLTGSDMSGALLTDAYLNEARINNVQGLTVAQLRFVRTVFDAEMPEEFVQFFKERHRDKLEKDPGNAWDTNTWSQDTGKKSLLDWFVRPQQSDPVETR